MNGNIIPITQAGLDKLQAELDELVNQKRPQLVERLTLARSMGDLSENSDYQSAKEDLTFVDGRSAELEELIKNSKVIQPQISDKVDFGNSVKVKLDGQQVVFQIVGEWEANPAEKKISHSSPLGQALLGKKVGDKVEVTAPAGKIVYTIVGIE
ncbi:MAG: transcription elongation factor GreA [bacterium]|nr:transcription elongation factor GreA [bacterium]